MPYLTYFEGPGWPTSGRSWAPMRRETVAPCRRMISSLSWPRATCHYRSPATLGDQLAATIWVGRRGGKASYSSTLTDDEVTGRLVAEGCSTQVWFDYAAAESRPVPAEIVACTGRACRERRSCGCETSAGVESQGSGVSQQRPAQPSPAAATYRPAAASPTPVPSCIAAAAPHATARRAHLGRITAIRQRPEQARQRRVPRADGAASGHRGWFSPYQFPTGGQQQPARGVSGTPPAQGVLPGPGDRTAGASRSCAPRRWRLLDPKLAPLPRSWA